MAATQTSNADIAAGASLSNSVSVFVRSSQRLVAIQMPANWTPADLTFQASWDGVTFYNFWRADGSEYRVEVEPDQWVVIDPLDFPGVRYIKIRSGTRYAPVLQLGARSLGIILQSVT